LAIALPATAWKRISWREGSKKLGSRFAAVRVRPAHRDYWQSQPHPEEWLLIEWPQGMSEPAKYWLSNLPATTGRRELVRIAKHRWIVERDYEELKQELGLGHFEGRGWRGFHHHATLCIAAYGFLLAERSLFSPLGACWQAQTTRTHNSREIPPARRYRFVTHGIIPHPSPRSVSPSLATSSTSFPVARFCGALRF
jgi:hypothetical protein